MSSPSHRFDVFLCHHSQDKPAVREIDRRLIENGIQPWIDERNLRGGSVWQDELERLIGLVPAVAVFIGPSGRGPWQDLELRAFLDQFANRGCLMIPVILDGGEIHGLSPFLSQFQAIDFRQTTPDPLVQLVLAIKEAQGGEEKSDKPRKVWTVPYRRNPYFVGREEILESLRERLTRDGTAALGQTQAISGLGGIGKTQTAVEYAYRYRDEYQAVLFVRADTEAEILTGYSELARELGLGEAQEQEEVVATVLASLRGNEGWLLILDNADTPELVKPFLPASHRGHVLVTSRARVFVALGIADPFEMETLSPTEALELLLKRAARPIPDATERAAAEDLTQEVGYLPLALEQAGAYILEKQCRFQDYLQSYRKRGLELLGLGKPQVEGHPEPVATTWSLNFREVEKASSASADLLRASAFFNPDEIPLEILQAGGLELGRPIALCLGLHRPWWKRLFRSLSSRSQRAQRPLPLAIDEILEPLTRFSLITRNVGARTYTVHRLVQEVMKGDMKGPNRRAWVKRVVRTLNKTFPDVELGSWPLCDRLVPHAETADWLLREFRIGTKEAGRLFNQAGVYLWHRGRYGEAEPLYQRSLEIYEKALGKDHHSLAMTLNNLASLYSDQWRYREAEPLYQRSLEIKAKALGKDHPSLATTLNNLASLYSNQCRYGEAEPLYQRSLEIYEKALGKDHPSLATTLNNLALLKKAQGRIGEAEPLYQRCLEIKEKALGIDHPELAPTLNNLALLYSSTGLYRKAEPLYQRSLEITEKALGKDHPSLAPTLNNLALLYESQGRYGEAEPLFQRDLEITEEALGKDHPSLAKALNNLALLYKSQGRYGEAEPLFQRAQEITEKALGKDHPSLAKALNNLALLK